MSDLPPQQHQRMKARGRRSGLTRRGVLAGAAALAAPRIARGQVLPLPRLLALVHSALPADALTEAAGPVLVRRLFAALEALGHAEGHNLVISRYSVDGHEERFAALAAAVVRHRPDVIVAARTTLVGALHAAGPTVPIVALVAHPVHRGMAASLARPGGNVTGVAVHAGADGQLQLLKAAVPALARVAFLGTAAGWDGRLGASMRSAAEGLGLALDAAIPATAGAADIRLAFDAAVQRADAIVVGPAVDFLAHRDLIVALAQARRIPAIYPFRDYVENGGLMAYGPNPDELAQYLAEDVHRVLGGEPAGEIPFHRPAANCLVINAGAAKAIGLALPPALIAGADDVIE